MDGHDRFFTEKYGLGRKVAAHRPKDRDSSLVKRKKRPVTTGHSTTPQGKVIDLTSDGEAEDLEWLAASARFPPLESSLRGSDPITLGQTSACGRKKTYHGREPSIASNSKLSFSNRGSSRSAAQSQAGASNRERATSRCGHFSLGLQVDSFTNRELHDGRNEAPLPIISRPTERPQQASLNYYERSVVSDPQELKAVFPAKRSTARNPFVSSDGEPEIIPASKDKQRTSSKKRSSEGGSSTPKKIRHDNASASIRAQEHWTSLPNSDNQPFNSTDTENEERLPNGNESPLFVQQWETEDHEQRVSRNSDPSHVPTPAMTPPQGTITTPKRSHEQTESKGKGPTIDQTSSSPCLQRSINSRKPDHPPSGHVHHQAAPRSTNLTNDLCKIADYLNAQKPSANVPKQLESGASKSSVYSVINRPSLAAESPLSLHRSDRDGIPPGNTAFPKAKDQIRPSEASKPGASTHHEPTEVPPRPPPKLQAAKTAPNGNQPPSNHLSNTRQNPLIPQLRLQDGGDSIDRTGTSLDKPLTPNSDESTPPNSPSTLKEQDAASNRRAQLEDILKVKADEEARRKAREIDDLVRLRKKAMDEAIAKEREQVASDPKPLAKPAYQGTNRPHDKAPWPSKPRRETQPITGVKTVGIPASELRRLINEPYKQATRGNSSQEVTFRQKDRARRPSSTGARRAGGNAAKQARDQASKSQSNGIEASSRHIQTFPQEHRPPTFKRDVPKAQSMKRIASPELSTRPTVGGKCPSNAAWTSYVKEAEAKARNDTIESDEGVEIYREPSPIGADGDCYHYVYQIWRKQWNLDDEESDAKWFSCSAKAYYSCTEANAAAGRETLRRRRGVQAAYGQVQRWSYELDDDNMAHYSFRTRTAYVRIKVRRYLQLPEEGQLPVTKAGWLPRHAYTIFKRTKTLVSRVDVEESESEIDEDQEKPAGSPVPQLGELESKVDSPQWDPKPSGTSDTLASQQDNTGMQNEDEKARINSLFSPEPADATTTATTIIRTKRVTDSFHHTEKVEVVESMFTSLEHANYTAAMLILDLSTKPDSSRIDDVNERQEQRRGLEQQCEVLKAKRGLFRCTVSVGDDDDDDNSDHDEIVVWVEKTELKGPRNI